MWQSVTVSEQDFYKLKELNFPIEPKEVLPLNSGIVVLSESTGQQLNAIFDSKVGIRKINSFNPHFTSSKNRDLALLNDHLNNPNIRQIQVDGFFGTGKTSTIMAHVVEYLKTAEKPNVRISKPHVPVGKTYGHLPGELKDKIHHEFRSFYQYIDRFWKPGMADLIVSLSDVDVNKNSMFYREYGGITLEALPFEYIRGLDFEDGWNILDEAQNTDIQEMVSFVSRNTDGVKLLILGDTTSAQIDRKNLLDPKKNGFAFVKETFKDKPYSATVELTTRNHIIRGERVKHLFDAFTAHNQ